MLIPSNLELGWFIIFVILLTGYAILDGFDLGVGMLHLFTRKDEERRVMLNSIGPVWDGNEVWLVTAGGALFAGFPDVYATMLSAFYLPVMILLAGLIFRAIAIEFRSKEPMSWWRTTWDTFFTFGSFLITFILGLIIGNLIEGIELDVYGEFSGNLSSIFTPYSILVGILTIAIFTLHGNLFLLMKTEKELHTRIRQWVKPTLLFFIITYLLTTLVTLIYVPHMTEIFRQYPLLLLFAVLHLLVIGNIFREFFLEKDARAFISSCLNILCLLILYGIGTHPIMVRAINNPAEYSLTIYNASSSPLTLKILFLVAFIGMPLVIAYTTTIYYIFRGKVKMDIHSY